MEYTRWLAKGKRGQERLDGWLARGQKGGRGSEGGGREEVGGRVSRVVEHRGPLVVWDGKGRVDMGW